MLLLLLPLLLFEFPKSKNLKEHEVDFINNRIEKNE